MQNNRSFLDEIKFRYNTGGMHVKLIFANILVFLIIHVIEVFGRLIGPESQLFTKDFLTLIFTLDTNLIGFVLKPWGILTSIFAHFDFIHLLFNMVFLYFSGKFFESYFGGKRLLTVYVLGGIAGGILEILAHVLFPTIAANSYVVVGASGSIMAIFIGLAFYRPNLQVMLFGILPVRLFILAIFFLISDFFKLGVNDGTAHFAHIGGALLGIFAVQKVNSSNNYITKIEVFFSGLLYKWNNRKNKSHLKVKRGGKSNTSARMKTDEEFNLEKKARQEKMDAILDKISKSGYENLSTAEKAFLFDQSKHG